MPVLRQRPHGHYRPYNAPSTGWSMVVWMQARLDAAEAHNSCIRRPKRKSENNARGTRRNAYRKAHFLTNHVARKPAATPYVPLNNHGLGSRWESDHPE
eukprot:5861619-Prymnesium_polylepis.1